MAYLLEMTRKGAFLNALTEKAPEEEATTNVINHQQNGWKSSAHIFHNLSEEL